MSQHVLWEVVKNNNAYLVKSNGLTLSRDPFNPSGVQTYGATGTRSPLINRIHPKSRLGIVGISHPIQKQRRGEPHQEGQVPT